MPRHGPQTDKEIVYIPVRSALGKTYERPVYVRRDSEAARKYPHSPSKGYNPMPTTKVSAKPRESDFGITESGHLTPANPEREHSHQTSRGISSHKVGEKHPDEISQIEHRNELDKYNESLGGPLEPYWADKLKVKHEFDKRITIHGRSYDADIYSHPKAGYVYVVNDGVNYYFISPKYNIQKKFQREREVDSSVKSFFEDHLSKAMIFDKIENILAKQMILNRINEIIVKSEEQKQISVMASYESGGDRVEIYYQS